MALTRLPTELLDNIITYVLPEGFESLALTCKKTFTLCAPFVEHHNKLRSHFQHFTYYNRLDDPSYTVVTAFDLITRIAVEPVVARYVRHADFEVDRFAHAIPRWMLADVECGGAVVRLLAGSPDLAEAGLDWEEYYANIEEDLEGSRYSQYAAAFLLTLLPNVETLTLPSCWKPLEATDKLINVVVSKTKQSHLPSNRPSLAQTTKFGPSVSLGPEQTFDLSWASPFLALPHMRSFRGPSCVASGDSLKSIPSQAPGHGIGKTLEAVHFVCCSIDEVAIIDFLRQTPGLRTFTYSHSTKNHGGPRDWDLCKFVTAIEREVGSHLVELSISIRELRGSINPGKASMRGFQRLQKLEFPLEIVICNITAAVSQVTTPDQSLTNVSTDDGLSIVDLIPASVSRLAINSQGTNHHEQALDIMFREFAEKASQLSALKDIHLACPSKADDAYKDLCTRLLAEAKQVGVILHLEPWSGAASMAWEGE